MDEKLDGFAVMRRNGEIFTVAVDPEDYARVESAGPWYVSSLHRIFYAQRGVRTSTGKHTTEYLHHFILGVKGLDHIDGNGLNNCKANLRRATQSENMQNRHGLGRKNTSGFRGVSFNKQLRKWQANIKLDGRNRYLGLFATAAEASAAASRARAAMMPFSVDARDIE